ncbi:MAG: leucine-rich repeat domain-containing protein [Lachnospiraceae bacterium]|nr:leucine-rich repeat domain-containing protein [Lachnospiraceae bacterium]
MVITKKIRKLIATICVSSLVVGAFGLGPENTTKAYADTVAKAATSAAVNTNTPNNNAENANAASSSAVLASMSAVDVMSRSKQAMSEVRVIGISYSMLDTSKYSSYLNTGLGTSEITMDLNTGVLGIDMMGLASIWVDSSDSRMYMYSSINNTTEFEPLTNKETMSFNTIQPSTLLDTMSQTENQQNITYTSKGTEKITVKGAEHNCYVVKTNEIDTSQASSGSTNLYKSITGESSTSDKAIVTFYVDGKDFKVYRMIIDQVGQSNAGSSISSMIKSSSSQTSQKYDVYYPESVTVPVSVKSRAVLSDSYEFTKNGVKYKVFYRKNKIYLSVVGATNKSALTILPQIRIAGKNYKVTKIVNGAFKYRVKLRKLVIGKNIRTIGKNAFYKCNHLKQIKVNLRRLNKSSKKYLLKLKKSKKIKLR